MPNSVVDACTVNAFKARLDKFWQHQSVKFDFTADLTGTRNQSEEVTVILFAYDADLEVSDTCVRNSLLSLRVESCSLVSVSIYCRYKNAVNRGFFQCKQTNKSLDAYDTIRCEMLF